MHDVTIRKKAMISQPMNGVSDEKIKEVQEAAKNKLNRFGFDVVDTYITDSEIDSEIEALGLDKSEIVSPIYYLGVSIERMAQCGAVYFCDGWEDARGCRIEHEVAEAYDLDIIYAEDKEEPEEPLTDEQKTFIEGRYHE